MCIGFQLLVLHQYARTLCVCGFFGSFALRPFFASSANCTY